MITLEIAAYTDSGRKFQTLCSKHTSGEYVKSIIDSFLNEPDSDLEWWTGVYRGDGTLYSGESLVRTLPTNIVLRDNNTGRFVVWKK